MVMASAGVNMPAGTGAAGGDGVGNPTAASAGSAPECRMRRRRRFEPRVPPAGSGEAAGVSWVRRLRPAMSSSSSSDSSEQEEDTAATAAAADDDPAPPEVQEMELVDAPVQPPAAGLVQQTVAVVGEAAQAVPPPVAVAVAAQVWPVAFGSVSMAGRMRMMEDTVAIHPDLCTWPPDASPMHFFAVFDGHGGSHVSALCRDRMHEFVAEELAREGAMFLRRRQEWHQQQQASSSSSGASTSTSSVAMFLGGSGTPPPPPPPDQPWSEQAEEERAWRAALVRSFRRVDAMAALACATCGQITRPRSCRCGPLSAAANVASGIVGSTAVVALLVRGRLVVANCGDSRAVLCRGPVGTPPVPLSFDHKPNRADEMARIQAAGGRVFYNNGFRVRGILAMSRAIGDRLLRPEVIPVPEITFTDRTVEDQCLILASDGMWDVIDNVTACNVARQCLEDGVPSPDAAAAAAAAPAAAGVVVGHEEEPRCLRAASLLARLAIGRETEDNISVIVIDLKHRE